MRHLTVSTRAFLATLTAEARLVQTSVEYLIKQTPTSPLRNEYTEVNLLLLSAVEKLYGIDRQLHAEANRQD